MNRYILAAAAVILVAGSALAQMTPEQTAGIYYAYPDPSDATWTDAPQGYEPFYVSHYGRHGSRWITEDSRYLAVINPIDSLHNLGLLTPLGEEVRQRLVPVWEEARGRSGSLSPLGDRQHRGIASRLAAHVAPLLSADSVKVRAVTSTSLRCAMSMAAFLESLKEQNPSMRITRTAYDRDYRDFIAHTTAEGKAFTNPKAGWWKGWHAYVAATVDPSRLMASLITDPSVLTPRQQYDLMMALYWVAADMQNVDAGQNFFDIFTPQELEAVWRTINARMYACNADAPINRGVMIQCAAPLLRNFIELADSAIAGAPDAPAANLRFGHDTHLLRLLALMGVEGTTAREPDMTRYHEAWQDYRLSPMAANIQLIFYRKPGADVLVKLLHNEHETHLPIPAVSGPYYRWNDVRAYWQQRMVSSK